MKEKLQKFLRVLTKSLILLTTLLYCQIVTAQQTSESEKPNIKILFISGVTNDIFISADCEKGFLEELYDNRRMFNKIKIRHLYLNTFSKNSSYIQLEKRLDNIAAKINKFNPNVIITFDEPSFFVICRIRTQLNPAVKIYYYGLASDAHGIMKEKAGAEFPVSGIMQHELDYDNFIKIFESKLATYQVIVLTNKNDTKYSEKTAHKLVNALKKEFAHYNIHVKIVTVSSIYDMLGKLATIKKEYKGKCIVFNMMLGLPMHDNDSNLHATTVISRNIRSVLKDEILVSLTYRSAQEGIAISYGPNFYQDGRNLFYLMIETYFGKTVKEIDSTPEILAFNLKKFYSIYADLIYQIKVNNKEIFYYNQ